MKSILLISCLLILSCAQMAGNKQKTGSKTTFTESEILEQLDLAFQGIPDQYFPSGHPDDIKYNFFLDLEHGYCETAGNRIHLYGDSTRWAIVFEKSGYFNRATDAEIELDYIGNCIDYPVDTYDGRNYISNAANITLIDVPEFERIENKKGTKMETFERIDPAIKTIKVRDTLITFDNDYKDYEKVGIKIDKDTNNPRQLIGFGDFVRYLNETNGSLISATQGEIRQHIPKALPLLMTIDAFHFMSVYDKGNMPGKQETYQLIARVLVTRNTKNWKPTQKPNNHWTNWESGNL